MTKLEDALRERDAQRKVSSDLAEELARSCQSEIQAKARCQDLERELRAITAARQEDGRVIGELRGRLAESEARAEALTKNIGKFNSEYLESTREMELKVRHWEPVVRAAIGWNDMRAEDETENGFPQCDALEKAVDALPSELRPAK
jgi:hypothetical protein